MPSYDEMAMRVGQPCRLERCDGNAAGSPYPAILHSISARRVHSGYEQFSLLFHSRQDQPEQQAIHAATFDDGISWEVFLVPVARVAEGYAYEACFNRTLG